MRHKVLHYTFLLVLACFVSCRNSVLSDVEDYIQDRPDSAIIVLRQMPESSLRRKEDKAKHALLTSMAMDKNYIDEKSDSAIVGAVNWYETRGNSRNLMLSYYYAGRIQFNASKYSGSAIYAQKALDLARETGDGYYEGLSCWLLGDIYYSNHNYLKANKYYSDSEEAFALAGKCRYSLFSKYEQAKMLIAMKDYQGCDSLLLAVTNIIDNEEDPVLEAIGYSLKLRSFALQGKDSDAINLFRKWSSLPVKADKFAVYGDMIMPFFRSGDKTSAERCLELAYENAVGEQKHLTSSFSALLMYANGDYKHAVDSMSKAFDYQNSVAYSQFANSIDDALSEYYKSESRLYEHLLHNRIVLLSIIAGILILAVVLYYFIRKRSYQERLEAAKQDIAYITQMNRDSLKSFNKFLQIRQNLIDDVIAGYGNEKSSRRAGLAYDVIDDKIENLKADGDGFKKLVKDLNDCFENIVKKLREHFPDISREEYHILVYYFSGFSQETVSLLTGVPVQKLYNLKRNWVGKFDQLPSPDRELFLARMNTSKFR